MALQKPVARTGESVSGGLPLDGASVLPTLFPTLMSYLADVAWADGSARVTSTCTVFVEGGSVKLCLNDRATGQTAWASGRSLEEAAEALEGRLLAGTAEWRTAKGKPGGRGR